MIGSLKSMSYLKCKGKIKSILSLLKRTQVVDIKLQYERYAVRAFDFHITFTGNNQRAVLKYDGIEYITFSMYEIFNYLNSREDKVYVKIILESEHNDINREERFFNYCRIIEQIYKNIVFFGGYRECDLKQIYNFDNRIPDNLVFYKRVDKLKK